MSMEQRAMKRIDFAALAGVHRGTVTKDCRTRLSAAVIGKRIDAAHPCAIAYLQEKRAARTAAADNDGLDPIYYEAVAWCHRAQRYSSRGLRDNFKIGAVRATAIIQLMRAAGEIPVILPTPPRAPATAPPAVVPATPVAATMPSSTDGVVSASPHATVDSGGAAGAVRMEDVTGVPENIQAFADMTLREVIRKFGTDLRLAGWLKATKEIEIIHEKRLKNAATKGRLVSRALVETAVLEPMDDTFRQLQTDGAKTIAARLAAMHSSGCDSKELEKFVAEQISSFIRAMKTKISRALRNA